MPFQLHSRLRLDCMDLGSFPLCRLLLLNDSRYPWFILVPQRADITEIYQLDQADRTELNEESCLLSRRLAEFFQADKMNTAALGNLVPQLHIHHIVRYRDDPAWPAPVWGKGEAIAYNASTVATVRDQIHKLLDNQLPRFQPSP